MRILILNAHSALNLGDDAIMSATLSGLGRVYPAAEITVTANDPQSWQKYTDIEVVSSLCNWVADCRLGRWRQNLHRMPLALGLLLLSAFIYRLFKKELLYGSLEKRRLLLAYYKADLVLSCGGGNYYAHTPMSPGFQWSLITLAFALLLGKRVIMLPQSFGPIEGSWQKFLARRVLSRASLIMLRDPLSFDFLQDTLHLKSDKLVVLHDLAFELSEAVGQTTLPIPDKSGPLRVGITVMDRAAQNPQFEGQKIYEDAITSLALWLSGEYKAQVFFLVQCYGPSANHDDRLITHRLYERVRPQGDDFYLLNTFSDSGEIMAAYGQMDCVVGTRMHTGILSLNSAVPLVLIGYQPKSQGMMTSFGLETYYCDIDEITPERLIGLTQNVLTNREDLQRDIATQLAKMDLEKGAWLNYLAE